MTAAVTGTVRFGALCCALSVAELPASKRSLTGVHATSPQKRTPLVSPSLVPVPVHSFSVLPGDSGDPSGKGQQALALTAPVGICVQCSRVRGCKRLFCRVSHLQVPETGRRQPANRR